MKLNYKSSRSFNTASVFFIGIFFLITISNLAAQEKDIFYNVKNEDVIGSVYSNNLDIFEKVTSNFESDRKVLGVKLMNLYKDAKASNLNQCCVAYYLGEIHFQKAVDILATNITLHLDTSRFNIDHLPSKQVAVSPAKDALIKIGTPSIPAVIKNLAENDDAKVRELSLQVLYRIDGDKDITHLRLQKALAVEKDSQKQARLQAALKSLVAM